MINTVLGLTSAILLGWSDPTFMPSMKCRGGYTAEQLEGYLPSARITMWLPSTRAVGLDPERRCLLITVDDSGGRRLAALVLRGVSVPRRAVEFQVAPFGAGVPAKP